jgi:toxin ParE1/3/4
LFVSRNATADLDSIWSYIAADSRSAADRLIERFSRRFKTLTENPASGRCRDELTPGIRSVPLGSYVIFYEVSDKGLFITRVLHGARDVETAYEQGSE